LPTITYLQADGGRQRVSIRPGMSLVEAALRHDVPGIDAKCRGNCACVTCHVHISGIWREVLGPPGPMEESMLDFAEGVDDRSRLACQVRVTDACEGMIVMVPLRQHILGL
jgi:ferredoxin, 2Fe-2S